jgi:AhpC/TSA family
MTRAFGAYPEYRNPFPASPIHPDGSTTVLYQGKSITLAKTGPGPGLLIDPADLVRVNGFEVKPQGACFGDLCIPMTGSLMVERGGSRWFDLEAFADLLGQQYVADREARVWSFAEIPAKRENMLVNAMAPDFEVKDRTGKVIRLSDYRGKKALIVTWSSW